MSLLKPSQILSGIGIHSGKYASVQFVSHFRKGIWFWHRSRRDIPPVPAFYNLVSNTSRLCTELGEFKTVEHVMSALFGMNISNALVLVDGDSGELPIMDGSCLPFVEMIEECQVDFTDKPEFVRIVDSQRVNGKEGSYIQFDPVCATKNTLEIQLTVDFDGVEEELCYTHHYSGPPSLFFKQEIAPAKTFAMERDLPMLKKLGLGLGGDATNCVVYPTFGRSNGQRVRHKMLDLLGDFALMGTRKVVGRIRAHRSGHALNHAALSVLMQQCKI